ncbi:MAG TPA: glycosyltransferase [Actinomycetes bacterium]
MRASELRSPPARRARRTVPRVLVLNDHALRSGLSRHRRGDYPAHLLHGLVQLQARFDVALLREDGWAARLPRRRLPRNLSSQLRALLLARRHDVLVSGSGYETVLAAVARRLLGLRRPGLVAIVHRPPPPGAAGRLLRFAYAAHDALLCISPLAYAELSAGPRAGNLRRVDWGVDLDFYRPTPVPAGAPVRLLSVGKTKRDHDVLVRAMAGLPALLELYCDAASAPTVPPPPNVTVHVAPPGGESLSYAALRREYARCHLVAVALRRSDDLCGLSSVVEAMACGRGVLCTRTRGAAVDPEALGFGRSAPVGDAAAWRDLIAGAVRDPALLAAWGARAREVAESRYDLERFAAELAASIEAAAR